MHVHLHKYMYVQAYTREEMTVYIRGSEREISIVEGARVNLNFNKPSAMHGFLAGYLGLGVHFTK